MLGFIFGKYLFAKSDKIENEKTLNPNKEKNMQ